MPGCRPAGAILLSALCVVLGIGTVNAAGARLFKSGPIQITADGQYVWVTNEHSDSVSRITASDDTVVPFSLPDPTTMDRPRGLSVTEDGSRVWVACHDSDRVYVLNGADGTLVQQVDLPWGSGPYSVALSRPAPPGDDQQWALVTLHRSEALAAIDTATFEVTLISDVYQSPLGIAWMEDGISAWVSHLYPDGTDPRLTRLEFSGPEPRVTSRLDVGRANPPYTGELHDPDPSKNLAEGGYLNFRGHLAQLPSADAGGNQELWVPTQYNNQSNDIFSPDGMIQGVLRKVDLTTREIFIENKIILTAVHVHDAASPDLDAPWQGYGWNAGVSGLVDIGFVKLGPVMYTLMVGEQSNDVIVFRWNTSSLKSTTDENLPGLPEVGVGDRPLGVTVSPTSGLAYVYNSLSFDVSVVDVSNPSAPFEDRKIAIAPPSVGLLTDPVLVSGAKVFHTSDDPRISINQKQTCASCHINAEHDGRDWGLHAMPPGSDGQAHGPRNTHTLLGTGLTHTPGQRDPDFNELGELHRSGDRDEIQDFEYAFLGAGGTGFIGAGLNTELGPPNAGLDPELDAMADYVFALPPLARSPYRTNTGALTESAIRGATFFVGTDTANKVADANCSSCHVPETAYVDFRYHDTGQYRSPREQELNDPGRPCDWCVNTATLYGLWASARYTGILDPGIQGMTDTMLDVLQDFSDPARSVPHGALTGLTGHQLADLAEFLLSIDGDLSAVEVRDARDTVAPRIVRVEPTSLTRVEVWFDETVDPVTSANVGNYRILRQDTGETMPITSAVWDARNGDRVELTTDLRASCAGIDYLLEPVGTILDVADRATDGVANGIEVADPGNKHTFALTDAATVTLGASGYENVTVLVHDASPAGPVFDTSSNDSIQLADDDGTVSTGFARFDWRSEFVSATGVSAAGEILDARFSIFPQRGDLNEIEARRVLQSWSDPPTGGDSNINPVGGPTWRDHSHPDQPWNVPGAGALGGTGDNPADYNGSFDLAAVVDVTVPMSSLTDALEFSGAAVTDAFRFWFDNPTLDYGYGLRIQAAPPARPDVKFHRGENELGRRAPVLRMTYQVDVPPVSELSGPGASDQLLVGRAGSDLVFTFEDLGSEAGSYNLYQGDIGTWYSHSSALCNQTPAQSGDVLELLLETGPGDHYFLVTASDCTEGTAGNDSSSVERDPLLLDCAP